MADNHVELQYLLYTCRDIYEPSEMSLTPPEGSVDLGKAIELAMHNGLVYHIACSDKQLRGRVNAETGNLIEVESTNYALYHKMLMRTLRGLDEVLGPRTFLVTKTIYSYQRRTKDVDIVVEDLSDSLDILLQHGFVRTFPEPPYKQTVAKSGLLSVTLHECIAWKKVTAITADFLWKQTRDIEHCGLKLRLPSVESDLLTLIAHIPFESLYFNLGDVLYIYALSREADWREIIDQARENGWPKTLSESVSILNGLHRSMYNTPSPIENAVSKYRNIQLQFPIRCPFWMIVRAHLEKRAWEKMLSFGSFISKWRRRSDTFQVA